MTSAILASCAATTTQGTFRGFATIGADLVLGSEGAVEYGTVPPGEDGAYVTVHPRPDGSLSIGTDDAGYGKLYFYSDKQEWAVSESLVELAEFARSKGWPLTRNTAQIDAFRMRSSMIAQQLTSHETAFNEIELLSPRDELSVGVDRSARKQKRIPAHSTSYRDMLSIAISELVGRMRTLLSSGIPLVSDLSGGRDSRVVLAAIDYAASGISDRPHLRFRSNPNSRRDFEVASGLAEMCGFNLNKPSVFKGPRRSPNDSYRMWRKNDLGVYHPIYPDTLTGGEIELSGAAGGAHRTVYQGATLRESMERLMTPGMSPRTRGRLIQAAQLAVRNEYPNLDEQLGHFRMFRNRIHGGRNSLRGVSIAPLAGKSLATASSLLDEDKINGAQFYADLMFNLSPALARHPYDLSSKGWDAGHMSDVTLVPLTHVSNGGRVFGNPPKIPRQLDTTDFDYIIPFARAYSLALSRLNDQNILRENEIKSASLALKEATNRSFKHAANAVSVSHILLLDEVYRLTA